MKVLVIAPHEHPVVKELPDLEAMQQCVGGHIQAVSPWEDTRAALVCDEEGLYHDSDWNRYICEGLSIKGTFFICGIGEEDFDDLPDDLIERFTKKFYEPEVFVQTIHSTTVMNKYGFVAML